MRLLLLIMAASLLAAGCASGGSPNEGGEVGTFTEEMGQSLIQQLEGFGTGDAPVIMTSAEISDFLAQIKELPDVPVFDGEYAVMETTKGFIICEFFTDDAPNHAQNFKKLANSGFYDWVLFHRVIEGFMIQTGDILSKNNNPGDDGTGGPGWSIDAEFSARPHKAGILSAARSSNPNSAGSQFFIVHKDSNHLNGQYSVFGRVVEGMDIVNMIAESPVSGSRPIDDIHIKRVRVLKPE